MTHPVHLTCVACRWRTVRATRDDNQYGSCPRCGATLNENRRRCFGRKTMPTRDPKAIPIRLPTHVLAGLTAEAKHRQIARHTLIRQILSTWAQRQTRLQRLDAPPA